MPVCWLMLSKRSAPIPNSSRISMGRWIPFCLNSDCVRAVRMATWGGVIPKCRHRNWAGGSENLRAASIRTAMLTARWLCCGKQVTRPGAIALGTLPSPRIRLDDCEGRRPSRNPVGQRQSPLGITPWGPSRPDGPVLAAQALQVVPGAGHNQEATLTRRPILRGLPGLTGDWRCKRVRKPWSGCRSSPSSPWCYMPLMPGP